jgi:ABC-type lipoprotein export system ATPase subunit
VSDTLPARDTAGGAGTAEAAVPASGVLAERRARAGKRLLDAEGLFHLYALEGREVVALQGVDFAVEGSEMVALLGPSGSGKSTMLSILGGLERPSAGTVLYEGVDITKLAEAQLTLLRRRQLGFVWQVPARNLLPYASAWDNLELPMLLSGLPGGRRRRRGRVLLEAVGLERSASLPIRALSGGEQQRLAVAVALANNPPLLLADEPTSQLDRAGVDRVVELLREAREDLGTTVVLVTHDGAVAAKMDRTVTIRDGRVSGEGRGGAEYSVVGPTGSLHLPDHALAVLPPGSRVEVEVAPGQVVLRPADQAESRPESPAGRLDPADNQAEPTASSPPGERTADRAGQAGSQPAPSATPADPADAPPGDPAEERGET